jgi:hypothetical protein
MATQYELRHPESMLSASPVLARARPGSPSHRPNPLRPPNRPTATRPRPQIGDSARLWHYMESQWMEGEIESIQTGYRVLVRCADGLEETVGWHLVSREGVWVEDVVGAVGAKA